MSNSDEEVLLAYDTDLKRPACVNLAAILGGNVEITKQFEASDWLDVPTDGMKVYRVPESLIPKIIAETERARRARVMTLSSPKVTALAR